MNKQDFTDYARAFSAGDYEGYSRFYTEDVVLELGSVGELRGRDRIVGFYREMNLTVQEHLTVHQLILDEGGIAADVSMEFHAHKDAPDFVLAPMKKGEVITGGVIALYTLRDGKISRIKTVRSRPLEGPAPAGPE
jgi:ketosteroid isomerase-like protein